MVEPDPSRLCTTFGDMNGESNAPLVVISGAAGTGKTTLARACARAWSAVVIDLDEVAVEETQVAIASSPDPTSALASIRDLRYGQLRELVREQRRSGAAPVIAVAPFTREVSCAEDWTTFVRGVGGGEVMLVWIHLDPVERSTRIQGRGALRDRKREDLGATFVSPPVPHIDIDGALDREQQVNLIWSRFDNGKP